MRTETLAQMCTHDMGTNVRAVCIFLLPSHRKGLCPPPPPPRFSAPERHSQQYQCRSLGHNRTCKQGQKGVHGEANFSDGQPLCVHSGCRCIVYTEGFFDSTLVAACFVVSVNFLWIKPKSKVMM